MYVDQSITNKHSVHMDMLIMLNMLGVLDQNRLRDIKYI